MGRPRTPIGTFGEISLAKVAGGQVQARTRLRGDDGQVRRVSTTGGSRQGAERNLKRVLSKRASRVASGHITADSSFAKLVAFWLADLDLENQLAPSTRALYERNMRQLVMPAFEHYVLREITVCQVDQFIKTLAATKSYSMAKQARTVLSLAFGLAVRYDTIPKNPVRGSRMAPWPRPVGAATGRTVGAHHRSHARHIGSHRRGAGHPRV